MKRISYLFRIAIVLCLTFIVFQTGNSQVSNIRGEWNYFYLRLAPGLSAYRGNLNTINSDKPYFGFAVKAGAGYVFSREISVGFDYRIADYPRTKRPSIGNYTRNHSTDLYVNYTFLNLESFDSYILGGFSMTFFGLYDDPHTFKPAFGPVFGGGIQLYVNPQFTLFLESKINLILDDEAMDERKGKRGMDAIGFIGAGIRMNLLPK